MSVRRSESISTAAAEGYRGTFAPADPPLHPGERLPPGWEGVYFPFAAPFADLRPDGTPANDALVPDINLPRRMYAGEDTEFLAPIVLGDTVEQETSLGAVVEKAGSSGRLAFVDIAREYRVGETLAIRSVWHDVFLEVARPDAPAREPRRDHDAAGTADWVDEIVLDARHLFRFSALTFNTHLVHYDRTWAREVEALPDLLVHGPLTRMLMMDAARRRSASLPRSLTMRAIAPVLVDRPIRLAGATTDGVTRVVALDVSDAVLATAEILWW